MVHVRFFPRQRCRGFLRVYPMAATWLDMDDTSDPTLAAIARRQGMSDDELMLTLARNCRADLPQNSIRDWTQESLVELIDHLQIHHHPYLESEIDRLCWLTRLPSACSAPLAVRLRTWIEAKFVHMEEEERELFPLCRRLDRTQRLTPGTESALRRMFSSHEFAGQELVAICTTLAEEIHAGHANEILRVLLADIVEILDQHIGLEDTVLLPAVVFACEVQSFKPRRGTRQRRVLQSGLAALRPAAKGKAQVSRHRLRETSGADQSS